MNWNWAPHTWKTSTRILLGLITIWPVIYIGLFMVLIFSGFLLATLMGEDKKETRYDLDLIQLERKIQHGEIEELRITASEIESIDRNGRHFVTDVTNESTREDIIRQARALDPNARPRVNKIDENSSQSRINRILPAGFVLFFLLHMITILLTFLLMPLYIVFAVKNDRHDQTMRIVWVVLMATIGMLAMPVYWYLYVWRKPQSGDSVANPS